MKVWKKLLLSFLATCCLGAACATFLLYGPIDFFRNLLITTAMTTKDHHWMAEIFYSDETIKDVLDSNIIIEVEEETDESLIDIASLSVKNSSTTFEYESEEERQILERDENDLYKVISIKGSTYQGYLVAVYDPTRISIGVTRYLGVKGENITDIAKANNAIIATNASGFKDPKYQGNGGEPRGVIIQNGKLIWNGKLHLGGGGIIGFTKEGVLVLSKASGEQALKNGIYNAVSYAPFLIVNGKASFAKGDGGWGIAPRTAIGQRADGIVLMLVIDGRQIHSVGASMVDLTEIMQKYGAVNAAAVDGGSSSALVINNTLINKPTAHTATGERRIPSVFMVK